MRRIVYYIFACALILSSLSCSGENEIVAVIQGGEELAEGKPTLFWLEQNSPNPFNVSTWIVFQTVSAMQVRIKVLTEDWQVVKVLVNTKLPAGIHSVQFAAKDLPNGEYYYTMEAKGITQIRKMKLLK